MLALISCSWASSAQNLEYGILAGIHDTGATSKVSGLTAKSLISARLGGVVNVPVADKFKFQTGLIYVQRNFEMNAGSFFGIPISATAKFTYLDVPLLAQYDIDAVWSVEGGAILSVNVGHSIDGYGTSTSASGVKTLVPQLKLGGSGKFSGNWAAEGYYEQGLGDIYAGAKNYSTFGVNFFYWL
jgi:hypothetical protein